MDDISDNNPGLEEMRERGWAWLQRSRQTDGWKYGAPYTDDAYATHNVKSRLHPFDEREGVDNIPVEEVEEEMPPPQELIIVSWED